MFLAFSIASTFLLNAVRVDSRSMEPTLLPGDSLFASPLVLGPRLRLFQLAIPGIRPPRHGDLVVIRPPYFGERTLFQRLADPVLRFVTLQRYRIGDGDGWRSSLQVKRIIGLPGDSVRMERFVAYVKPAGGTSYAHEFELSEGAYELITGNLPDGWLDDDPFGGAMREVVLGPDEYFVLADNRNSGTDSRQWGPVRTSDIVSLVVFRYWPPGAMGAVR